MVWLASCCVTVFLACGSPAVAQELAFVSERDGESSEIYAIGVDGTGERNLSRNPAPDEAPAWSPDGTQIAFARGFGSDADVWVMNPDGGGQRRLTSADGADRAPDWSPDGRRIVFASERSTGSELYVMNADGTGVTQLTDTGGAAAAPAWSPDGSRIAYWREDVAQVWGVGADGRGDRAVSADGARADRDPAWSPDGRRLAFSAMDSSGSSDLLTSAADGSGAAPLASTPAREIDADWSPDGIAFSSDRAGDLDVWTTAADGSGARRVTTHAGDDTAPAWRPRPESFTGALPGPGGSITVGAPAPPAAAPPSTRRAAARTPGFVRLTMRGSSVALRGKRLVVTLRFSLSAPASGTFRVHHRGRIVMRTLHRGRRGANVVRLTRRVHDARRWNGRYRLSVVNLRRRP
jgi:Tol biopolymer transport system component